MKRIVLLIFSVLVLYGCAKESPDHPVPAVYLDNSGRDDVLGGGVKMIPVETPKGNIWHGWRARYRTAATSTARAVAILQFTMIKKRTSEV